MSNRENLLCVTLGVGHIASSLMIVEWLFLCLVSISHGNYGMRNRPKVGCQLSTLGVNYK